MPSACKGQTRMVFFTEERFDLISPDSSPLTPTYLLKHTPHCVNDRSVSIMLCLSLLGGSGVGHRLCTYMLSYSLSRSHFLISTIFFCIVTFCILDNRAYLIPFLQTSATYCNVKTNTALLITVMQYNGQNGQLW